jgi:DNA-binding response OmpR family regulator
MFPALLQEMLSGHAMAATSTQLNAWPTLLVVDSDADTTQSLVCFFEKRGFHVAPCETLAEAKDVFQRRKNWTLVIADYHLPDGTGSELCLWIQQQSHDTPFLLMSGSPHFSALCTDSDFLPKPCSLEKLESYVRTVLHTRRSGGLVKSAVNFQ